MIFLRGTLLATLVAFDSISLSLSQQTCVPSSELTCTSDIHAAVESELSPSEICKVKLEQGECNSNQEFMFEKCPYDCLSYDKLGTIGYFSTPSNTNTNATIGDNHNDNDGSGGLGLGKISNYFSRQDSEKECVDKSDECPLWAEDGDCNLNPQYMMQNCAKTCMVCSSAESNTFNIGIRQEVPPNFIHDSEFVEKTLNIISETSSYMARVMTEDEFIFKQVRYECRNHDEHCAALAAEGRCDEDDEDADEDADEEEDEDEDADFHEWMMNNCAPACQACDELAFTDDDMILKDCRPNRDTDIFKDPGQLDEMFLRLVGELPYGDDEVVPNFVPKIHSRPSLPEGLEEDDVDYYTDGPWIVTLDNFLTDEECDALIKLGAKEGYERSYLNEDKDYDEEQLKKEYESDDAYRTSTNSWCMDECYKDSTAQRVIEKIATTTGVPDAYSEYLQLLRYVPGQYYKVHHDYITDSELYSQGPRILTFFLYLNDVEEGGATRFSDIFGDDSDIKIDVHPKKGTALVWPSVLSHDLNNARDERTYHEAMPVVKGMKFGANAWLHLRDVKNDDCDYDAYYEILEREGTIAGAVEYDEEDEEEDFEDDEEEEQEGFEYDDEEDEDLEDVDEDLGDEYEDEA